MPVKIYPQPFKETCTDTHKTHTHIHTHKLAVLHRDTNTLTITACTTHINEQKNICSDIGYGHVDVAPEQQVKKTFKIQIYTNVYMQTNTLDTTLHINTNAQVENTVNAHK